MVRDKYKLKKPTGNVRPSKTIPGQSMSVDELVRRYVKGLPVDAVKRQGVYVDQSEHDLEKLARQDFSEKAEMAEALQERHEAVSKAIETSKREKRAKEEKERSEQQKKAPEKGAGIGPLDNTMPDDTNQKTK